MAARLTAPLLEVVELPKLSTGELDPLLHEEIGLWERDFNWDFRPSADLLRRFVQVHSLFGHALMSGNEVVGYAYHVCEGRKGLIGDFYLRSDFASAANEAMLLGATVKGLMHSGGIRRIECQLMMLRSLHAHTLPCNQFLTRYERKFMEVSREISAKLPAKAPDFRVSFCPWAERHQEEIAHLVSAAYRGHVDSEINDQYRTIPGARHFLTNIVRYPGCGTFSPAGSVVAIDDHTGRVCGACLASQISETSGHVTQLCVLPAIRGARLGYELLRQTLRRMNDAGCNTMSLTVTSSNASAIRLYESVGFRTRSEFPALVWEGF